MRKVAAVVGAVALTLAAAGWAGLPVRAGAQGGGTIEVEVHYNGVPVIEDIKINNAARTSGSIRSGWARTRVSSTRSRG